jgi:hypothetical protein
MKKIIKTFGLLSVIAVIPGAFAATSRVSMISRGSPRLPSIAGYITSVSSATTTSSSSGTSVWGDVDCIDNYTDCITAEDACGSDFEECTTNVLFHAQMPKCSSVLIQCSTTGINSLFGTSDVTALSNVASTTSEGEVDKYTYPTDGSFLGQRIVGGAISNRLTTEQCVRRYTSCLNRDDICGADFELCTSQREFKKQAVLCASTLARCDNEGKKELFGSLANASSLKPEGEGARLKAMIEDGQQLAAMNAVKTCQRVTDNCLISACLKNPWRCVEGTSMKKINTADFVGSATSTENTKTSTISKNGDTLTSDMDLYALTGTDIRKNLKAQCLETIGTNKYCHMTYREKSPNNKELMDIDLQEDVFSLAYAARKEMVNVKIQEELKKFDTEAKGACVDTIVSCAMRSCGGGIGSVCFKEAKSNSKSAAVQINGENTYKDIKSGCAAIVNTDPNCIYAATAASDDGYEYAYINDTTFGTLFPEAKKTLNTQNVDPIGAVAYLNSLLATSYNDAAIEKLKKQCQTTALACVKSMCGTDYENCYRNRTDIVSGSYDTGNKVLDRSMNKVGGVLDYNIVMGLCMNTVSSSSVCEEHLKIAASDLRKKTDTKSWYHDVTENDVTSSVEYGSVREAWLGANTTKTPNESKLIACRVGEANATEKCRENDTKKPQEGQEDCIGIYDDKGCIYTEPVYVTYAEYILENAGKSLFQELLANVEKEVQAKYNAKLTKEQNTCLAQNNGGIMGGTDNGSTFMWAKLTGNGKVPNTYNTKGLSRSDFTASNDLYGSFCRARITLTSDDKMIQEFLTAKGKDLTTAYFAVGDAFTCGSWINSKTLDEITRAVGERELCNQGYGSEWNDKTHKCEGISKKEQIAYAWGIVAPSLAGLGIGVGLGESGVLGKWLNKADVNNSKTGDTAYNKKTCTEYAKDATDLANTMSDPGSDSSKKAKNKSLADAAVAALKQASGMCKKVVPYDDQANCGEELIKTVDTSEDNAYGNQALITQIAKKISDKCERASDNFVPGNKGNKTARAVVPIMTTLAAGGLGAGITASVIAQKKEDIKNEAVQEWMEEIGEHIQCYLGAQELGSYGDVVSFTIE